jgi:flagella basal body P-ring formation protein FlgA
VTADEALLIAPAIFKRVDVLEYDPPSFNRFLVPAPLVFLLLIGLLLSPRSWAEDGSSIRESLEKTLAAHVATLPGRASTEIGRFAENARYARCTNWTSALPAGSRLWGKVSLNVRCTAGITANLYVSATIRVAGNYVISAHPISAGQIIRAEDVRLAEGELSELPPDTLVSAAQAAGRRARVAIGAAQPLRSALLRDDLIVQAGQEVKLQAKNSSFTVANSGRALDSAARGEQVRVRLPSGQIVLGTARENGVVDVRY